MKMTSEIKCKGCGEPIQENVEFCPHCGMSLGKLENRYIFETMKDYASMTKENLERFLNLMKNPEELEERIQEEKPQIFEKQREITQKILNRFPEIRRHAIENPEVEFKAFIISTPYETDKGILQHDCLLRQLAMKQNGLVNFSLGSAQLATDLYAFDVPVWAPKKIGHELLYDQQLQIKECMPESQEEFLYCAEPWWVCSKVFDLDGRWVNWRLLFKTEGFEDYLEKKEEVPLNFHIFSNMKYSHLFSIAGTSGDGEVLLGVHKNEESKILKEHFRELGKMYEFGKQPEITTIKISWNTLESLGLIGISARKLLKSEAHFFRKTFSERIIEDTEQKTVSDTRAVMTGDESASIDEFMAKLGKRFLWYEAKSYQEGVVKITHGIPREYRKEYRVLGDKT